MTEMNTPLGPTNNPLVVAKDNTWPMMVHLSAFSMFVIPFGNIVGPLVVWLAKRDEDATVDRHGCEAVNFQLTFMLLNALIALLTVVAFFGLGASALFAGLAEGAAGKTAGIGGAVGSIIAVVVIGLIAVLYCILYFALIVVSAIRAYDGREAVYFPNIRFLKPKSETLIRP